MTKEEYVAFATALQDKWQRANQELMAHVVAQFTAILREINAPELTMLPTPEEVAAEADAKRKHMRDAFAASALHGLCASLQDYSPSRLIDAAGFADEAYGLADAMLAQRDKTSTPEGKAEVAELLKVMECDSIEEAIAQVKSDIALSLKYGCGTFDAQGLCANCRKKISDLNEDYALCPFEAYPKDRSLDKKQLLALSAQERIDQLERELEESKDAEARTRERLETILSATLPFPGQGKE